MTGSKRSSLEQLIADRKRILADLTRTQVSDSEPEYKRLAALEKRRLVKAELAAINGAIKAAGGRIRGGKAFSSR